MTAHRAVVGDTSYELPTFPLQPLLFDLDRTGDRLLVTALWCQGGDRPTREGLAVFERDGDGWRGVSVLPSPAGHRLSRWDLAGDRMWVNWMPEAGEREVSYAYRWTGTVLAPAE